MNTFNKILEYIYYVLAAVWSVWGGTSFFFKLATYHRNVITAVYGLLFLTLIIYLGYLHKKTATNANSLVFPLLSLAHLGLIMYIVLGIVSGSFMSPQAIVLLAGLTFATLLVGTLEVRKIWNKSILLTLSLIAFMIVWTFIFIAS